MGNTVDSEPTDKPVQNGYLSMFLWFRTMKIRKRADVKRKNNKHDRSPHP